MDRFRSIEVFVRVAELENLSAAGRELGLSPAGVGNHVRALEEWLGARLLHRTTRRISVTEAGQRFFESAHRIVDELADARSATSALQTTPRGILRLTAPMTFGMKVLAPVVADYLVDNPETRIDLVLSDRRVDLIEDGFDMAIRVGDLEDSGLIARSLATTRLVLCASPAYLKRRGRPHHPRDLGSHDCLEYTLRAPHARWIFTSPRGKRITQAISSRLKANNGDVLRAAALRGLGLTLTPQFVVNNDLERGTLVTVMGGFRLPEVGIFALYPSSERVPLKVRSFLDYLAKQHRRLSG